MAQLQETKDFIGTSIRERKQQIKAAFSSAVKDLLTQKRMSQVELMMKINQVFADKNVLKNPDDKKEGVREIQAWDMSRYVRGSSVPDIDLITAVAETFEIEPDDLVPGFGAVARKEAFTFASDKLADGRFFCNFSGIVDPDTHAKLMTAIANSK